MARIDKGLLTKTEIVTEASKQFLENGYSNTTISAISKALRMSPGNLTFHYPTKEHLLAELVSMLCDFQWKLLQAETDEGQSPVIALCLELATIASACEVDPVIKDFFVSSYSSPMCLGIIRMNDAKRAKEIFCQYRPDWTDQDFTDAEALVSGVEFATLMTVGDPIPLETRIAGALQNILHIYGVPADVRKAKIEKVFSMDYRNLCKRILMEFKEYVKKTHERNFRSLLHL